MLRSLRETDVANRRALLTVALAVAVALLFSTSLPLAVMPAAMETFLFLAALGAMLAAVFRRESMRGPRLTGWDQAMMLLFLSMAAGFLVDQEAVHQHLEAMRAVPPAAG